MSCNYSELPHTGIKTLQPYIPGKSVEELAREQGISDIIKLASNENPLGCSPMVLDMLANISGHYIATYPSPSLHPLTKQLSQFLDISESQLTLSNGSDFIYTLLMMLFALQQDKHILTHDKAFLTYQIQAQTLGIPFRLSPLKEDWSVDISAMIEACRPDTAIVFLANPNNPTGVLVPESEIRRLLKSVPESTLVVVDEAYYEFAYPENDAGALPLLNDHPNLVITRTFSKVYGLAGLRLGYAIAQQSISELLKRIQLPFTVNQVAMAAAVTALQDQAFVRETLALNREGMQQMREGLAALKLKQIPSACNFISFDCGMNAMPVYQKLQQHGIIVRPLAAYGMPNHLRVSIGKPEHTKRFLDRLPLCLQH
ncbi:histidinol-phosphate transaminase [Legionella sp. CNM-4043-24]|uniref:histidinol-phosphate transaminase n=1 Tax=Legionella sp. CNM-4043-24 TaxID=3421646 RepID=UPI00403AF283